MINKSDFYSTVGEIINFISNIHKRPTKKATRQKIADMLNISLEQLKKYEEGKEEIGLYDFFRICKTYKFPFFIPEKIIKEKGEELIDLYDDFLPKNK